MKRDEKTDRMDLMMTASRPTTVFFMLSNSCNKDTLILCFTYRHFTHTQTCARHTSTHTLHTSIHIAHTQTHTSHTHTRHTHTHTHTHIHTYTHTHKHRLDLQTTTSCMFNTAIPTSTSHSETLHNSLELVVLYRYTQVYR